MQTKLLLHGGRLKLRDSRNDDYFKELTKDLEDGDELLFVGFARTNPDDRRAQYEKERDWILSQTDKDIKVVFATEDAFIEQIKRAKSIEITGGESDKLVETIRKYPEFIESLSGKTVGGSSAGACLFSSYYYYHSNNKVLEGLKVLPIKLHVHNNNSKFGDRDQALSKLKTVGKELELVTLDECEWIPKIITF